MMTMIGSIIQSISLVMYVHQIVEDKIQNKTEYFSILMYSFSFHSKKRMKIQNESFIISIFNEKVDK